MKKLYLLTIMLFVLGLGLMGCTQKVGYTNKGWALKSAKEYYESDYGEYGLFAYQIEELTVFPITDGDFKDYYYDCYQITFIDYSGHSVIYNVFVAYEENLFENLFRGIKESNIIEIDVELS